MRKSIALFSIFSLIVMFSCTLPSGVEVTKPFPINDSYYYLFVSDGMDVVVSDEVDEIVITADENVMEKIKVEVTSSTLRIFRRDVSIAYPNTTTVLIPFNHNLRSVEVGLDAKFSTEYGIGNPSLSSKVKVEGRGKFEGYVIAKDLDLIVRDDSEAICEYDVENKLYLEIKGGSEVTLDGYAAKVQLEMNDSKITPHWSDNYEYYAFSCYYCYGNMDYNSEAYIDCEDELAVNITNNSTLYYTSDPDIDDCWWDESSDLIHRGGY